MRRGLIKTSFFAFCLSLAIFAIRPASAEPIKIGYCDWPGWVAWEVAIQKGFFKEAESMRVRMVRIPAPMDAFPRARSTPTF